MNDTTYSNIATKAMSAIFNRQPRDFQQHVIPHILKIVAAFSNKENIENEADEEKTSIFTEKELEHRKVIETEK